MGRLSNAVMEPVGAAASETSGSRSRGEVLSDAAYSHKRIADALIEQELGRIRMVAGFAGCGGLLALLFGLAAMAGLGQPMLLGGLAGVALLVPTAHAFALSMSSGTKLVDASFERGLCQSLAVNARRLSDSVGATDVRNVLLGPEAIINTQIDSLYKDLERARQRLMAAGGEAEIRTQANRMHERIVPSQTETFLVASDGRRYAARIVDVSQSGVALKGTFPTLYAKEEVLAGARRASVIKVGQGQVALSFLTPIQPSELNKRIVL